VPSRIASGGRATAAAPVALARGPRWGRLGPEIRRGGRCVGVRRVVRAGCRAAMVAGGVICLGYLRGASGPAP